MKRSGIALAGLIVVGVIITSPATAGPSGGEGDFCGPRVVRDFLNPLTRMTPIRHVPRSGKLPFGPKGLTLEVRGGRLVVGGGSIGFGFSDDASGQVRRLNWDVSTQLVRVDAKGEELGRVDARDRRIGTVSGNRIKDFVFRVSGKPAYYRIDISFSDSGSGELLGTFSNYVRVVRPSFNAKILRSSSLVRSGDLVSVRLANYGTETLSSLSPDWQLTVEQFNGAEWVIAPGNPPSGRYRRIIQKLPAGQVDGCIHFRVPAEEQPGRYRFSMFVRRSLEPAGVVRVIAEFEVAASH